MIQLDLLLCLILLCDEITPIVGLNWVLMERPWWWHGEGDWVSLAISILYFDYGYLCLILILIGLVWFWIEPSWFCDCEIMLKMYWYKVGNKLPICLTVIYDGNMLISQVRDATKGVFMQLLLIYDDDYYIRDIPF